MGRNFYLESAPCAHCGRSDKERHIGKSSFGWCFAVHVYPEDGINTLEDWQQLWSQGGFVIRAEEGDVITPDEMYDIIANRKSKEPPTDDSARRAGYKSIKHMLQSNHAQIGPNGLLRSKLGGDGRCVGHGSGTYEYFDVEFS